MQMWSYVGALARRSLIAALLVSALTAGGARAAGALPPPPNDPLWSSQWSLSSTQGVGINLLEGWRYGRGKGVVVAVIDSGVVDHPEFSGRVLPGFDFISDPRVAGDGDGRDADPRDPGDYLTEEEIDAEPVFSDCKKADSDWHGTHVAGVILGAAGNGKGIAGVAPLASLLPIRVTGKCGGSADDLIDALYWAGGYPVDGVPENENPAQIVNLSLGSSDYCRPEMQAAIDALSAREIIVVAAAGNEANPASGTSPANCDGTLTVGATTNIGQRAGYSNFGSYLNLSAPGGDDAKGVISSVDSGRTSPRDAAYKALYGTSMAAPHVSGILAIARGVDPLIPRMELLTLLINNLAPYAVDQSDYGCSIPEVCGVGFADAGLFLAALEARQNPVVTREAPASMLIGESATVRVVVDDLSVELTVETQSICERSGDSLTALSRGICILTYAQAATAEKRAASGQLLITIRGLDPEITAALVSPLRVGSTSAVSYTSLSGAPSKLKSLTPKVCTITKKGLVKGVRPGRCSVRVRAAATATYEGASITLKVRTTR
jgi:hypothetical protein